MAKFLSDLCINESFKLSKAQHSHLEKKVT